MNVVFSQDLLWVPIEVVYEGTVLSIEDCIVDTGSATTAVDINLIPFNYRKPARIRRLRGVGGGTQEVVCQTIDRFSIGSRQLHSIDIEFGDISSNFGINGFIGNDILQHFFVAIDFQNRQINLLHSH